MALPLNTAFVAIATLDFEQLCGFYGAMLGQTPQKLRPGHYGEFSLGSLTLGIFVPKPDHQPEFFHHATPSPVSLCLEVEDLEATIAHLTAIGYPPPGPVITASHGREIYGYDPEGNRLIFHCAPDLSLS